MGGLKSLGFIGFSRLIDSKLTNFTANWPQTHRDFTFWKEGKQTQFYGISFHYRCWWYLFAAIDPWWSLLEIKTCRYSISNSHHKRGAYKTTKRLIKLSIINLWTQKQTFNRSLSVHNKGISLSLYCSYFSPLNTHLKIIKEIGNSTLKRIVYNSLKFFFILLLLLLLREKAKLNALISNHKKFSDNYFNLLLCVWL
jgi:hypothetical protein